MWQRLFPVNQDHSPLKRSRARMFYFGGAAVAVLYTLYFAFFPAQIGPNTVFQDALLGHPFALTAVVGTYGFWALMIMALRAGHLERGGLFLIAQTFFSGFLTGFYNGFNVAAEGIIAVVFMMLSALVLFERGLVIGAVIAIGGIWLRVLLGSAGLFERETLSPVDAALVSMIILGTAILVYLFLYTIRFNRLEALMQSSEEQLRLATITTKIATLVNRRQPLESVLHTAIDEILRGYPTVYHAQIFLNDEANEYARLVASTGEVGQLLLSRKHALAVGSQSVIGQVTATGRPIIARAGAPDGIHKRNELLPDTQVEVALPLIVDDRVIGALDVQSRQIESFLETEVAAL
ncbi:MAG: GAF domain-containing protein, partial [Anaerolinea sp.]|nr:GAF domain-containing protein [Anaerolinea sp.]